MEWYGIDVEDRSVEQHKVKLGHTGPRVGSPPASAKYLLYSNNFNLACERDTSDCKTGGLPWFANTDICYRGHL